MVVRPPKEFQKKNLWLYDPKQKIFLPPTKAIDPISIISTLPCGVPSKQAIEKYSSKSTHSRRTFNSLVLEVSQAFLLIASLATLMDTLS